MADPVRALLVARALEGGGAERFLRELGAALDPEIVDARLVALRGEGAHGLGHRGPSTLPRTVERLARLLERTRADVVVSASAPTALFVGHALAAARGGARWIARVANIPRMPATSLAAAAIDALAAPLLRTRAARVVAPSRGLAAFWQEALARPVETCLTPMDAEALERAARASSFARPDAPLVVYCGRLARHKRVDLVVEAVARLGRGAHLWIVGDGERRAALERRAGERVILFGHVDNPLPLVAAADVVALASEHEGSPRALIEAQLLGVPAVATRCPFGPDEIIDDGVTGMLVPVGDAAALARALGAVLDLDEGARRRMGAAAKERAHRRHADGSALASWRRLLVEVAR